MKRTRLIILAGLLVAALFVAVLPALAFGEPFNYSFEGDQNGDNIPDKWNVKGDVVRVCNHAYTVDACMMAFLPSSSGAALWQRLDDATNDWTVVTGEGALVAFAQGWMGAKQLDSSRAYAE